jgi:hypothetical protein
LERGAMTLALAYIDPGTGSMLFTIVIGFAAAAYFVVKQAWIRVKTLFAGRGAAPPTKGKRERIVIYSEGKRYWNVFLPIVEELERRGVQAAFLTSDKDDPAFERPNGPVRPQYIGAGNLAYARLNMLEADLCLTTTPGLDVYQWKRSKAVSHYSHILHSVDDATSYRLFGLDYFDSVLLTGEYQAAGIRELEGKRRLRAKELPVVGSTYLDVYARKLDSLPRRDGGAATVLVSPSWGESALLRRYGEDLLAPLSESGLRVIVRPHPQSALSEGATIECLKTALSRFGNVEWDFSRENLAALTRSDVMISDFSGIIFDYAFLFGRPVLYANGEFDPRPYDSSDVDSTPWKFSVLPGLGRALERADFGRMREIVESVQEDESLKRGIDEARDQAWQHRSESGARAVDFMLERAGV